MNSVAAPQSVAEVKQLVKRLYQPGNPQLISSIQDQLQRLQRSNEGWQLADELLASEDVNIRFFGALTFTVKLNNDGPILDEETAQVVLQRLISWLVRLVQQSEGPLVIKKLTLTLVTYFLRSSLKWETPLLHLLCSFNTGEAVSADVVGSMHRSAEDIISTLSLSQNVALLWFSTSLADEARKMEHSGPAQASVHVQLEREVSNVSTLIKSALLYEGEGYEKARGEGLRCFQSWTNYAQPIWPSRPEALQYLRDLLNPAMRCLLDMETEQDALEVFIDLLESYTSFFQSQQLNDLASVIQSQFNPQLMSLLEESGPVYSPAAQFIIAYGIAIIQDVVELPESARAQVVIQPLGMILKSSGYPGDGDELSNLSIEFWNTYIEYINDVLYSKEQDETDPPWLAHARIVSTELVQLLWRKMWMPTHDTARHWNDAERDEFRQFRMDAADLISSIYIFMDDMLQGLVDLTLQSLSEKQWRAVEAGVFCINSLADNAAEEMGSDPYLAALFGSTLLQDVADFTQSIPSQVRRTIIDMLGNYGSFAERHPEFLPDAVRFLFTSLDNRAFASVAAKSISHLCSSCRDSLTGELDGFLGQYRTFAAGSTSDSYTKEKVIGGIAAIIQALQPDSAKVNPLIRLLENVEKDISLARHLMSVKDDESAESAGVTALQCLASIGKRSQIPDDVPINIYDEDKTSNQLLFWTSGEGRVVQEHIIGCLSVLDVLGKHGEAIDAACQVLRSGFTETMPGPFVLPAFVTVRFLQQCSVSTPQLESVLSTSCLLITQHSRPDSRRIDDEVRAIYEQVAKFIQDLGQPSDDPGVAQGCIDVVSRLIPIYTEILFSMPSEKLTQIFNFTLQAIEGPDPMPKRAAAEFWSKVIKEAASPSANGRPPSTTSTKAQEVVSAFGQALAQTLIRQIAGIGQRSDLESIAEPLKFMFARYALNARRWVETALWSDLFPPVSANIGDTEKRRFLQQLANLRGGLKTKDVIKEFYVACRGTISSYT